MFVLVLAVPALVVVVTGYAVGYALAAWVCGLLGADVTRTPEVVGWTTGLLLLAVVVWFLLGRWRRRGQGGPHQK
jgi:biotin transporter BioY